MAVSGASDIEFKCDPGAIFKKVAAMDDQFNEYFFQFITGSNITIRGCHFQGLTTDYNTVNAGEQGVAFMSVKGVHFENNEVEDIGDAEFRATTAPSDSSDSNSSDVWVVNNIFRNVTQVTTTPASATANTKAGASDFWVLNNKFYNQKWSLKACTRSANNGVYIIDNKIYGDPTATYSRINVDGSTTTGITSNTVGVELCSVSGVQVKNNEIYNTPAAGITAYTNSSVNHFDYQDYDISGNLIDTSAVGIRFANDNGLDGVANIVSGIKIHDNTIRNINGSGARMIIITGAGGVTASVVYNNLMINPSSGQYMNLPGSGVTSGTNWQF